MSKTYTHLTLDDRITIQILLEVKLSFRAIARKLNRALSTLTREFKRVTSRKIVRTFYKQMRVAFVPPLYSIQGRFAS